MPTAAVRPEEPVEILVWDFGGVPGHREWIRQAVRDFNATRDDIRVELETPDWKTQRESLISTTVMGEGPDVVRVHHKYSVEFGELGGLLPLETFSDWPEVRERRNGLGWPGHPAITEIQRHISDAVNRAMTGVTTPREALDHAAAQVDELLADY